MGDVFHRAVPDELLDDDVTTMMDSQHTFRVLTKRLERANRFMLNYHHGMTHEAILLNVWIGATVESNDYAWRAVMLRGIPAASSFPSIARNRCAHDGRDRPRRTHERPLLAVRTARVF